MIIKILMCKIQNPFIYNRRCLFHWIVKNTGSYFSEDCLHRTISLVVREIWISALSKYEQEAVITGISLSYVPCFMFLASSYGSFRIQFHPINHSLNWSRIDWKLIITLSVQSIRYSKYDEGSKWYLSASIIPFQ